MGFAGRAFGISVMVGSTRGACLARTMLEFEQEVANVETLKKKFDINKIFIRNRLDSFGAPCPSLRRQKSDTQTHTPSNAQNEQFFIEI